MITTSTTMSLTVWGRYDIPGSRANLRVQLIKSQFSPLFIGRAVTAFTGLSDLLLLHNDDQPVDITLLCLHNPRAGLVMESRILGAAAKLNRLLIQTKPIKRFADECEIIPEDSYLRLTLCLWDNPAGVK